MRKVWVIAVVAGAVALFAVIGAWRFLKTDAPPSSPPQDLRRRAATPPRADAGGVRHPEAAAESAEPEVRVSPEVEGIVLDDDGNAIAGARVQLFDAQAHPRLSQQPAVCGQLPPHECGLTLYDCECIKDAERLVELASRRQEPVAMMTTTSDAAGRFAFHAVTANRVYLLASKVGRGEGDLELAPSEVDASITLSALQPVTGVLTGEDERPIRDAAVTLLTDTGRAFDAFTGAKGEFHFDAVPRGDHKIIADLPGYLPLVVTWSWLPDERIELVAQRPRMVGGIVVQEGEPVAEIEVTLRAEHFEARASTDAAGEFIFEGLPVGSFELTAERGALRARTTASTELSVMNAELRLFAPSELALRVLDESGEPVPGARLFASHAFHDENVDAAAQEEGVIRVEILNAGEWSAKINARGFAPLEGTTLRSAPPGAPPIALMMRRSAQIHGVVVSEDGAPVASTLVRISARTMEDDDEEEDDEDDEGHPQTPLRHDVIALHGNRNAYAAVFTDEKGEFSADELPPGDWVASVHANAFRGTSIDFTSPCPPLRIVLKRGASVSGVVLDANGQPAKDASVTITSLVDEGVPRKDRPNPFGRIIDVTDEGAFELAGLDEGAYLVVATTNDELSPDLVSEQFQASTAKLAQVTLRFGAGLLVEGLVVDQRGRPVNGASVTMISAHLEQLASTDPRAIARHATTTERGRFTLRGLGSGSHQLHVSGDDVIDRVEETRTVELPHRGLLRIEVHRYPLLEGRVVTAGGRPISSFTVGGSSVDDPDGRFRVPNLVDDDGHGIVTVDAFGFASTTVRIPPGTGRDLDLGTITLRRGRTVRGMVVKEDGTGAANAGISSAWEGVDENAQGPELFAETGTDGRFELQHVPDAPIVLYAYVEGHPEATLTIAPGQNDVKIVVRAPED